MPFTPFHFGPALLVKSFTRKFSFTLFVFSQIVMDCEPLYFMLRQDFPAHRIFHTFLGCNLVMIISALLGKPLCAMWLKIWNYLSRSHFETKISWKIVFASTALGAYSHVLLDGLMHRDMQPFWPFISGNPMLEFGIGKYIALLCTISGTAGVLVYVSKIKKANAGS